MLPTRGCPLSHRAGSGRSEDHALRAARWPPAWLEEGLVLPKAGPRLYESQRGRCGGSLEGPDPHTTWEECARGHTLLPRVTWGLESRARGAGSRPGPRVGGALERIRSGERSGDSAAPGWREGCGSRSEWETGRKWGRPSQSAKRKLVLGQLVGADRSGESEPRFLTPGGPWPPPPRPVPAPPPELRAGRWEGAEPHPGKARSGGSPSPSKPAAQRAVAPPPPAVARVAEGGPRVGSGEGRGSDARSACRPSGLQRVPSSPLSAPRPPFGALRWRRKGWAPPVPDPASHKGSPTPPRLLRRRRSPGSGSPGTSGDLVRTRKRAH